VIGALVLYGVLFVILNSHNVSISFVLFHTNVPVLVALLLAGGIGVGAGWLLANRHAERQKRFKPERTPDRALRPHGEGRDAQ